MALLQQAWLKHLAFALLKPDAVLSGRWLCVVDHLERKRFALTAFRIVAIGDDAFRIFHRDGFRWDVDDWAHNREAYRLGPSVGCLLQSSHEGSAQARLAHLKGAALPDQAARGTIRRQCGATNRVLNLLHCPESESNALAESIHVLGEPLVTTALRSSPPLAPLTAETIRQELTAHGYLAQDHFDPRKAMAFLEQRIAQAAIHLLPRRESTRSPAGTRADEAQTILDKIRAGSAKSLQIEYLWHCLGQLGIFASELERYLIKSHCMYGTTSVRRRTR